MFTFEDTELPPPDGDTILPGHIRQILHAPGDDLLVLQGLGVRVLDRSGAQRQRWLPDRRVLHLARVGKEIVLTTPEGIFVAEVGAELGDPVTSFPHPESRADAGATHVAVLEGKAVRSVDRATGDTRTLELDAAGVAALRQYVFTQIHVSPDGKWVYAGRQGDVAAVWSTATGERVWQVTSFDAPEHAFFLESGELVTRHNFEFYLRSPEAPAETQLLQFPRLAHEMTVVPAPGGLAIFHARGAVHWSLAQALSDEGKVSANHPYRAQVSAGVESMAVIGPEGLRLDDTLVDLGGGTWWFSVDDRGTTVAYGQKGNVIGPVAGGAGVRVTAEEDCLPGELDMTGQTLVLPCGPAHKGRTLYELSAAERTAEARAKTMAFTSYIRRFGGRFAVGTSNSVPGWFGGFDFGKKRAAWKVKGDEPNSFAAEPGCARGVISWLDGVHTVHELVKGKEVDSFQTARSRGLAMSADTIATIDVTGQITLRREGTNTVVEREEPTRFTNLPLAFTEDGQHLLVGASDGSVEIRDAADGALRRTLVLHAGPFKDLRVAGGELFSLGTDGALKVVSL